MNPEIHRRDWLLAAGLGLAAGTVRAQNWIAGVHYFPLSEPVPGPPGKVEVVEFFWYGCHACNAFEPALQEWVKKLPPWVSFRHQPLLLREAARPHQRLFFVLQAMGVEAKYRAAIFAGLHQQRLKLDTPEAMLALLEPLGLDGKKFRNTWAAFAPGAFSAPRIEAANRQATNAYRVNGVPTLVIGGRFQTTPVDANERRAEVPNGAAVLRLTDHLLSTLRPA